VTRRASADDDSAVKEAARIIRRGGIVAFPTETVYGLGADAGNPEAAARIFEAKERPRFDPLIVHVPGKADALALASVFPRTAHRIADAFWPGPLTIVLPKRADRVPDIVTAGLPTVALRSPSHPATRKLLAAAGCPIAAPSANRFGAVSPTTAEAVIEQLDGRIDMVLDGGPCPIGVESTIVLCSGEKSALLRPGGLPLEEIEAVAGPLEAPPASLIPQAPGSLPRHYAPRTPLFLVNGADEVPLEDRAGAAALLFAKRGISGFSTVKALSEHGDMREAAANLFSALAQLDVAGTSAIYAERAPETGLGRAINDRLKRASAR